MAPSIRRRRGSDSQLRIDWNLHVHSFTIVLIVGCILPTFIWLENPRAIAVAWLAAAALTFLAVSGLGSAESPTETLGCVGIFVLATLAIPILIVAGRYDLLLANPGQCLASSGLGALLFPMLAGLPNFNRRGFSKIVYTNTKTGQIVGGSDWEDKGLQNSRPKLTQPDWLVSIGLGAYLGAIVGLIIWVQNA